MVNDKCVWSVNQTEISRIIVMSNSDVLYEPFIKKQVTFDLQRKTTLGIKHANRKIQNTELSILAVINYILACVDNYRL